MILCNKWVFNEKSDSKSLSDSHQQIFSIQSDHAAPGKTFRDRVTMSQEPHSDLQPTRPK